MNLILCPLRNGLDLARKARATFVGQDIGDVSILWIDNSEGRAGITEWLRTTGDFTITCNPGLGVAESWNRGLGWAFDSHPMFPKSGPRLDHVLVVNNDVELRPDTYRLLVEDRGLFVTAVGVKDPEKIKADPSKFPYDYNVPDPAAKRPHPDFSCYLIHSEVWRTVGKFDEAFAGGYAEDSDFHLRMHRAGITAYCLDLPFLHHASQTVILADELEREHIQQQADRNREYFYRKYGVEVGSEQYYELFGTTAPEAEERTKPRTDTSPPLAAGSPG